MARYAMLASLLALAACSRAAAPPPLGEGRLAVDGGRIWYKVSGTAGRTPLVLLHGGPGFSSFYLKAFEDLGDERIVVRYDQLGGGKSDTTSDTTLFTIAHFVRELDSLRSHLGIQKWHVLGHSWGTILALEYYQAHPDRVASLTFGSPVFDIPAYERRARELLATISKPSQQAVRVAEATNAYDAPAYQNAINEFYGLYVFRHPVQADLDSSFATFNNRIYTYMQGPSEFTITGTLKQYDVTSLLPQIHTPTLVTVGEFDEVGPELVRTHARAIPGARYEMLAGSAHITPWDARDANVRVVRQFLRSADSLLAAGR
ncbi:MAG TPA: proline iminopeptidase-family hydrolase [Gemmatimonadales bacterium]|nr:proline iminopeptidase-family hydrolase [Gemmatimonadales bacterium]